MLAVAAIVELLTVQTYPLWSLSLFALAIVAMYGLIAHGAKVPSANGRERRNPSAEAPASGNAPASRGTSPGTPAATKTTDGSTAERTA